VTSQRNVIIVTAAADAPRYEVSFTDAELAELIEWLEEGSSPILRIDVEGAPVYLHRPHVIAVEVDVTQMGPIGFGQ
jgi:aromatic ring-cleaving dioxygenase